MIVFTTMHDDAYQPLADLTLEQNKRKYCEKYGYPLIAKTDGWVLEKQAIGFEKVNLVRDALQKYPECDWVFFSECDAMITNFDIKLEQLADDKFHFILPSDINGINCGNFMIRNSPIGRAYLDSIESAYLIYKDTPIWENSYIQHTVTGTLWQRVIKVVPQRLFNSYDYDTLPRYPKPCKDALGYDGQWQPGDFIIHFANQSLEQRIQLAKQYIKV
jgi:hypothetical protein